MVKELKTAWVVESVLERHKCLVWVTCVKHRRCLFKDTYKWVVLRLIVWCILRSRSGDEELVRLGLSDKAVEIHDPMIFKM